MCFVMGQGTDGREGSWQPAGIDIMSRGEAVFRFTGGCVGNTVVAGKRVSGFASACGEKTVSVGKSGFLAVGGLCARAWPKKKRRKKRPKPSRVTPTARTAEALPAPVAPSLPLTKPTPTVARLRKSVRAQPAKVVAKKAPVPEAPAAARRTAAPAPTPEEVDAATFGGMAQKVLFKKALVDLATRDETMRVRAAEALGGIRHELSARALAARYFVEPSARVRKECVSALASLEIQEAAPVMGHALRDGDEAVRLVAVMGTYRLAGAACAPALTAMLGDGNAEVRRMAACCLGWTGQAAVAVKLAPLLGDESPRVRRTVAEAMGSLANRSVVHTLIECFDDPDEAVRRKVFEALERITAKRMGTQYPEDDLGRERLQARWRHWWREQGDG